MAPIWKPKDKALLGHWIETILDEAEEKLSGWERDFIDSISQQLERRGQLSEKQEEILECIYADKTS